MGFAAPEGVAAFVGISVDADVGVPRRFAQTLGERGGQSLGSALARRSRTAARGDAGAREMPSRWPSHARVASCRWL